MRAVESAMNYIDRSVESGTISEEDLKAAIAERLDTYLDHYGSTLVGRAFDTIDPSSKADGVEFFSNLFARAIVDPSNLSRIR